MGGKFAESQPGGPFSPLRTGADAATADWGSERCSQLVEASPKLRPCTSQLAALPLMHRKPPSPFPSEPFTHAI